MATQGETCSLTGWTDFCPGIHHLLTIKQFFNELMMATFKFFFRSDVQFNVVATNAVGASPAGPNSPIYSVIGKRLRPFARFLDFRQY